MEVDGVLACLLVAGNEQLLFPLPAYQYLQLAKLPTMSEHSADLPGFAAAAAPAAAPKSILKKQSTIFLKEQKRRETESKMKGWYDQAKKRPPATMPSDRGESSTYAYAASPPQPKSLVAKTQATPETKLPAVNKDLFRNNDRKRPAEPVDAVIAASASQDEATAFDVPRKKASRPDPPLVTATAAAGLEGSKKSPVKQTNEIWNIVFGKSSRETTPIKPKEDATDDAVANKVPAATSQSVPSPGKRSKRSPVKTSSSGAPPKAQVQKKKKVKRPTASDNSPEAARSIAQEALRGNRHDQPKTKPKAKPKPAKKAPSDKKKEAPKLKDVSSANATKGGRAPPAKEIFSGDPDDDVGIDWTGWTKKTFRRQVRSIIMVPSTHETTCSRGKAREPQIAIGILQS